jgi:hypothetical protein
MLGRLAFGLLLLLAACGDLPQPFLGNPGGTAMRLAKPPTPRLAVPPPADALLPDAASATFATALATQLQTQEVPAVAAPVQQGDWHLAVAAEQHNGAVVPTYTVYNPKGEDQGKTEGQPIPTEAWAAASLATMQQAAIDAAPHIAMLLTHIQTSIMAADPHSLYNRAARVMLPPVTGAPGDGNAMLTKLMRSRLSALGPVVQDTANGADFTVQGQVKVVTIGGGQQRVEIQWIVTNAANDERGRVVQLNDIPAGTLDHYWGDVAEVVTQEASGGVRDVILRQSGHEPGEAGGKPGATPASAVQPSPAQLAAPPAAQPAATPAGK